MWPYNDSESDWLARPGNGQTPAAVHEIRPERVAYYVAEGRRLRDEAIARGIRRFAGGLRRMIVGPSAGPSAGPAPSSVPFDKSDQETAHEVRAALASIRASSEILRDHPDLPSDKRAGFLNSLLAESERLQRALSRIIADLEPSPIERHQPRPTPSRG